MRLGFAEPSAAADSRALLRGLAGSACGAQCGSCADAVLGLDAFTSVSANPDTCAPSE